MSQRSQVSRFTLQSCEDSDCQFGQSKGQTMSPIELFWTAKKVEKSWKNWGKVGKKLGKSWKKLEKNWKKIGKKS